MYKISLQKRCQEISLLHDWLNFYYFSEVILQIITTFTFIGLQNKFSPTLLFRPTLLLIFSKFPSYTFIPHITYIRNSRVSMIMISSSFKSPKSYLHAHNLKNRKSALLRYVISIQSTGEPDDSKPIDSKLLALVNFLLLTNSFIT